MALSYCINQLLTAAVDFLVPHRCFNCKIIINSSNSLCASCWGELRLLDCYQLETRKINNVLLNCISVAAFDGMARDIVHLLKYENKPHIAGLIAKLMYLNLRDINYDIVIPIPIHKSKLMQRGYNQAALIAKEIARLSGKIYIPDMLIKHKKTQSQVEISSYKNRLQNVKGSIMPNNIILDKLHNKIVLLIDDVITTGATMKECIRVLKSGVRCTIMSSTFAKNI